MSHLYYLLLASPSASSLGGCPDIACYFFLGNSSGRRMVQSHDSNWRKTRKTLLSLPTERDGGGLFLEEGEKGRETNNFPDVGGWEKRNLYLFKKASIYLNVRTCMRIKLYSSSSCCCSVQYYLILQCSLPKVFSRSTHVDCRKKAKKSVASVEVATKNLKF